MTALMLDPENAHLLLDKISRFQVNWTQLQKETFPSIEGILLLDDIVGFLGEDEVREFAVPYIRKVFASFESKINFFHNDANGCICAPFLIEMGVHLFNFSFEHSLQEMRALAGEDITLLGNLPPRDVLAAGTPEQVYGATLKMYNSIPDKKRVIWSAGGGMPQGVSNENITAFVNGLKEGSGR
jgi:uroporphyrinogen decarboxylase